jgi:hypothetical protein
MTGSTTIWNMAQTMMQTSSVSIATSLKQRFLTPFLFDNFPKPIIYSACNQLSAFIDILDQLCPTAWCSSPSYRQDTVCSLAIITSCRIINCFDRVNKIRVAEWLAVFFFLLCTGAIVQNIVASIP